MAGSVFKSEMNWSSYQSKLYNLLESLERSIEKSSNRNYDNSKSFASNMSSMEKAIHSIAIASENSAKNLGLITKDLIGTYETLKTTTSNYEDQLERASDAVKNLEKSMDEADKATVSLSQKLKEAVPQFSKAIDVISKVSSGFGKVVTAVDQFAQVGGWKGIGEKANSLSATSNQMIFLSGMSGEAVREFRSTIMSTVSELNLETGAAFSPTNSYEQVVSYVQGVTGNLEAIEEMARPLLLSRETLDVNIGTVADLMNRFYTRYAFSSENMEGILDSIKGNTAGNSANSENTLKAMNELEILMAQSANGDADKIQEYSDSISSFVSYIESMGFDPMPYIEDLKKIFMGLTSEDSDIIMALNRRGIGISESQSKLISGSSEDFLEVALAAFNGRLDQLDAFNILEAYNKGAILNNNNFTEQDLLALILRENGKLSTYEEFLEQQSKNPKNTMVDSVEDKYISLQDKANNWLEGIWNLAANIQENLGFGISDLALISAVLGKNGISSIGEWISKNIFKIGASTSGASLAGGSIAGITSVVAAAAPYLAAIAAAGGIAYLGYKWYDNAKALSGNAEVIKEELNKLEDSLKDENQQRLNGLLDLEYAVKRESDLNKQKELALDSGLITQADLDNLTEESSDALLSLIESYRYAAASMNETTDGVMKTLSNYYTKQQDEQQDQLVRGLKMGSFDESQRNDIINIIKSSGITDEDLLDKISKAQKDGKISQSEFNDIIYGGANAWFDKNNIQDQALPLIAMQRLSEYAHLGLNFESAENASKVGELLDNLINAKPGTEKEAARKAIQESGLESEIRKIIPDLEMYGYAQGTNYIPHDQIALLHEGEAVIPKKYNPAANIEELKKMANEMQNRNDSSETRAYLESFIDEVKEIRAFLVEWKEENIRRETVSEAKSRYAYNRAAINGYNPRTT